MEVGSRVVLMHEAPEICVRFGAKIFADEIVHACANTCKSGESKMISAFLIRPGTDLTIVRRLFSYH